MCTLTANAFSKVIIFEDAVDDCSDTDGSAVVLWSLYEFLFNKQTKIPENIIIIQTFGIYITYQWRFYLEISIYGKRHNRITCTRNINSNAILGIIEEFLRSMAMSRLSSAFLSKYTLYIMFAPKNRRNDLNTLASFNSLHKPISLDYARRYREIPRTYITCSGMTDYERFHVDFFAIRGRTRTLQPAVNHGLSLRCTGYA